MTELFSSLFRAQVLNFNKQTQENLKIYLWGCMVRVGGVKVYFCNSRRGNVVWIKKRRVWYQDDKKASLR